MPNKEIDRTQPEPQCKLKHTLRQNTNRIALLDTRSTFNLTNDEELITNVMEATWPIASRMNVGQQEMKKCGEKPELTEQMWLDERSMITVTGFSKSAEQHCTQFDNWNGVSSQVHTEA